MPRHHTQLIQYYLKRIPNTYYEHILPISKQGKLITGADLIKKFNLKEGEQIGKLLKEIEERQFDGENPNA